MSDFLVGKLTTPSPRTCETEESIVSVLVLWQLSHPLGCGDPALVSITWDQHRETSANKLVSQGLLMHKPAAIITLQRKGWWLTLHDLARVSRLKTNAKEAPETHSIWPHCWAFDSSSHGLCIFTATWIYHRKLENRKQLRDKLLLSGLKRKVGHCQFQFNSMIQQRLALVTLQKGSQKCSNGNQRSDVNTQHIQHMKWIDMTSDSATWEANFHGPASESG